ncbi:MAG: hypothetical protein QNK11_06700 [Legionella sp.]|nr:hypothetical protein [Legionella sp.]
MMQIITKTNVVLIIHLETFTAAEQAKLKQALLNWAFDKSETLQLMLKFERFNAPVASVLRDFLLDNAVQSYLANTSICFSFCCEQLSAEALNLFLNADNHQLQFNISFICASEARFDQWIDVIVYTLNHEQLPNKTYFNLSVGRFSETHTYLLETALSASIAPEEVIVFDQKIIDKQIILNSSILKINKAKQAPYIAPEFTPLDEGGMVLMGAPPTTEPPRLYRNLRFAAHILSSIEETDSPRNSM